MDGLDHGDQVMVEEQIIFGGDPSPLTKAVNEVVRALIKEREQTDKNIAANRLAIKTAQDFIKTQRQSVIVLENGRRAIEQQTKAQFASVAAAEKEIATRTTQIKVEERFIREIDKVRERIARNEINRQKRITAAITARAATERKLNRGAIRTGFLRVAKDVERANARIIKSNKGVEKSNQSLIISWQSLSRLILIQVVRQAIFELINATRQAITEAAELQIKISEVRTISQEAQLTTEQWTEGLRRLSDAYSLDILDQVEAAYQALSNQVVKGAEAFEFLETANRLAIVGVATSAASVNLLTAAINAFGLEVSDSEEIAASFFKTVELGRVRIDEMSQSIGRVLVPANQLGVSLNELQAAIATATIRGIRFNEASTLIRNVLLKLIRPTDAMRKFLRDLGFETGEAAIQALGLAGFLAILEERTQGSSDELGKLFGRIRAITGAFLFAGEGLERFDENFKKIQDSAESFNKAVAISFESSGRKLRLELDRIRTFFITEVGTDLVDTIVKVSESVGGLTVVVKTFVDIAKISILPIIALFLALALSNPFTAIALAIGVVITAITFFKNKAEQDLISLGRVIKDTTDAAIKEAERLRKKEIQEAEKSIDERVRLSALAVAEINKEIFAALDEQVERIKLISKEVADVQKAILSGLKEEISALNSEIKKLETEAGGTADEIARLFRTLQSEVFQLDIRDQPIEDQLNAIAQRIIQVNKEANAAAIAGDRELLNANEKLLNDFVRQSIKLSQQSLDAERKGNEEVIKLIQKRQTTEQEGLRKILQLRLQLRGTRNLDDRRKIEEQIAKITGKINEDTLEIDVALRNINVKEGIRINAQQALIALFQLQKKRLLEIQKIQEATEAKRKEELADRILLEERLRLRARQFEAFDLGDVLGLTNPIKIREAFEERQNQVKKLIALQELAGGSERQRNVLLKQLTVERIAIEERITTIQLNNQQKLSKDNAKNIKELLREQAKLTAVGQNELIRRRVILKIALNQLDVFDRLVEVGGEGISGVTKFTRDQAQSVKLLEAALKGLLRAPSEFSLKIAREEVEKFRKLIAEDKLVFVSEEDTEKIRDIFIRLQAAITGSLDKNRRSFIDLTDLVKKQEEEFQKIQQRIIDTGIELETTTKKTVSAQKQLTDITVRLADALERVAAAQAAIQATEEERARQAFGRALAEQRPLGLARGGTVSSPSRGSDTVPAMLSPGEFVVNANSARRFHSQLVAMNSNIQRFNRGGPVTNIGDINVSLRSSGRESVDIVQIGKGLRQEIRRGRIKLT